MGEFERADYLMGIRYWAFWSRETKPGYEVFKYIGFRADLGLYFFQSVKRGDYMHRSFHQLNIHGFYPFVLDFKRIVDYLDKQGDSDANV